MLGNTAEEVIVQSRWRRTWLVLVTLALALSVMAPVQAATCQGGSGDYAIDCTLPDTQGCNGANSTQKVNNISGLGQLELRHDAGCRSIWSRTPDVHTITNLWAYRPSGGGCLPGSTSGLSTAADIGNYRWSRQLNDKNCIGRASLTWGGTNYHTAYY